MDAVQICLGNEAGGRVAVAFDESEGSWAALERAVMIARQRHGRLTIIAVAPKPWFTMGMAGVCMPTSPARLAQDLLQHAECRLREAVATVPDDIPCLSVLRSGRRQRECFKFLAQFEHDILVTPPASQTRLWRVRGSRHAPQPTGDWLGTERSEPSPA